MKLSHLAVRAGDEIVIGPHLAIHISAFQNEDRRTMEGLRDEAAFAPRRHTYFRRNADACGLTRSKSIFRRQRRRRDEESWNRWYRATFPKVVFHAFELTRDNPDRTSDLVQETYAVYVQRQLDRQLVDDTTKLTALIALVDEVWRETVQRESELPEIPLADAARLREYVLPNDSEADLALRIRSLRADEQRIVRLIMEGRKLSEIADEMKLSYTATGVRVFRLKNKLKEMRT